MSSISGSTPDRIIITITAHRVPVDLVEITTGAEDDTEHHQGCKHTTRSQAATEMCHHDAFRI